MEEEGEGAVKVKGMVGGRDIRDIIVVEEEDIMEVVEASDLEVSETTSCLSGQISRMPV